jgi:hypothetical protein
MDTSPLVEDLHCFLKSEWVFVRTLRGERIEDIRNRKDTRHQLEPSWCIVGLIFFPCPDP